MTAWRLIPRDGLILSDGRPFQTGLSSPKSLLVPHPETLLGMITTQSALNDQGRFDLNKDEALKLKKQMRLCGPILTQQASHTTQNDQLLAPAPLDCVWSEGTKEGDQLISAHAHRMTIKECLISKKLPISSLRGYALAKPEPALGKSKPLSGPAFWKWDTLMQWLAGQGLADSPVLAQGISDPTRFVNAPLSQNRFHVTMAEQDRIAKEGHLFITNQVNYTRYDTSAQSHGIESLALTFWTDHSHEQLKSGLCHLGGETKVSYLQTSALEKPSLPPAVAQAIAQQANELERVVRVTLLTPALFKEGAIPNSILASDKPGERHELLGWVTGRPQAISGWDVAKNEPKPHRRMAPAGSSYWLRLTPSTDPVAWAKEKFMTEISDQASDRNMGFGLCVVGAV